MRTEAMVTSCEIIICVFELPPFTAASLNINATADL